MSMYRLSEQERKFYTEYYKSLEGGIITKVSLSEEDDEGNTWPQLEVTNGDTTFYIEVSRDEEGNGPGFLFGLIDPRSKQEEYRLLTLSGITNNKEGE